MKSRRSYIMAKTQFPIDGKMGKQWKVTSYMGWRKDPLNRGGGGKRHHNGTDIWGAAEPLYIEAFHDGKVLHAGPSKRRKADGSVGGFGYHVVIQHKIGGVFYTSCYAHMKQGSIAVKAGQKVTAGTVLGKMGTTGDSTGKHLHFEIWKGKTHGWSADGKGFVEPIAFIKALMAKEAAESAAPKATPEDAPVAELPAHSAVAAPAAPVAVVPAEKIANPGYPGTYLKSGSKGDAVKYLQQQLKVPVTGVFDAKTVAAVKLLQKRTKLTVDGIVGPKTWAKLG
jgi:murein DD-endopeptidase MepM/ murein hydrolase activator NlpD